MRPFTELNILYDWEREARLLQALKELAVAPWEWREPDQTENPPNWVEISFHRAGSEGRRGCTLSLYRDERGQLGVIGIHADDLPHLTNEQYSEILQDFDRAVAAPAAERVGGTTYVGSEGLRLEDYLPNSAVLLLERYCQRARDNRYRIGPEVLETLLKFFLRYHRWLKEDDAEYVHGQIFGACLNLKGWWPEDEIPLLVDQYNFAMQLLELADATNY